MLALKRSPRCMGDKTGQAEKNNCRLDPPAVPALRLTKTSRLHSHWLHSQAATRLFESSPKRRGRGNQRGEGGRPEDVSCLDSGRQQHGAQIWTKDRTDSPNPQGPTDAGRANRGRIVLRRQRIRTRLRANHTESRGQYREDQKRDGRARLSDEKNGGAGAKVCPCEHAKR